MELIKGDTWDNQNLEVQIFIIKQVKRNEDEQFKERYKQFLGEGKSFFSKTKDFSNFVKPLMVGADYRTSFLVPLISIDKASSYKGFNFEEQTFSNKSDFNDEDGKAIDKVYWNATYDSIKKCPLLDFTKNAYVFQTITNNQLGISSVVNFNVQLSVNAPSSATITLENYENKYNFTSAINATVSTPKSESDEKELYPNDIYKSVFETDDIVILRVAKRANKNYKEQKYTDLYSNGTADYYQTVFTGFINNVNESINWNSKTQTVSLVCQGASKLISYVRLITGQAVCDMDSATAIVPISTYSIPQAQGADGKYTLDNESIVKNVIVRTLTSIDKIKECFETRKKFLTAFQKLYNNEQNDNIDGKQVQNYRTAYNDQISKHFMDYIVEDKDAGYYEIFRNAYKGKNRKEYLPIFRLMGTQQPAYQYAFNTFKQMFVANWESVYQFIKKIADNLQFNFYDDQYGVIHFEIIDTDMKHLYDTNDPNWLTQVISYSKDQDTNAIANVMPIYAQGVWAGTLEGQNLGIGAIVRDDSLIAKYGERPMTPRSITGLIEKKACERYGRELLDRMNRRINTYTLSLIGDPSLKLAKYAYFQSYRKLFYVEQINHQYNAGSSLITNITCTYERFIIADVLTATDNAYSSFQFKEPKNLTQTQSKFNYLRGLINNKLKEIDTNYISTLKQIFEKVNQNGVASKLLNILKNQYGYSMDGVAGEYYNKLYMTDDQKQNPVIPFLYLDGYYWVHNFSSDLYAQAVSIEKVEKENRVKIENDTKKKEQKKGSK